MYRVNKKNLSLARLMPRGKNGEERMKYLHASPKGVTVISPAVVARVTLPMEVAQPSNNLPVIWIQSDVDEVVAAGMGDEIVTMPEGRPAVTGPDYLVPVVDKAIPEPGDQVASFTCNAETLLKVLKVVCDVSDDASKTIRIRLCPEASCGSAMRIDAYRQPGHQEFVAVIRELEYYGKNIPGDKATDGSDDKDAVEVKPVQGTLGLKANAGRKFRG